MPVHLIWLCRNRGVQGASAHVRHPRPVRHLSLEPERQLPADAFNQVGLAAVLFLQRSAQFDRQYVPPDNLLVVFRNRAEAP
jgi:hypothetical protein